MSRAPSQRIVRLLDQAEGYLLLDLPQRALEILESRTEWPGMYFESNFFTGEALRALGRFREALPPLERAAAARPSNVGVAISLGWCYKRTHRLAQAIHALERARREHPEEALLHYNLACYWSLAGNATRALDDLGNALRRDPDFRRLIASEPDFDTIRDLPAFRELLTDPEGASNPA